MASPLSLLAILAGIRAAPGSCPIQLRDATRMTGISFVHTDGSSGRRYIVETVSCGLALFDYDGDGDIDIYFLNGAPLPGSERAGAPTNALYRNDGAWRFADVTGEAGVGDTGYGLGVAVGDYDDDGDPDIYVSNFGPNVLYRNEGDGTFTDATEETGLADGEYVGAGVAFLDADGDGDLDLYVSRYVDFTYQRHRIARFNAQPAYVGPMDYPPTPDAFYRNAGDGTFVDASAESGIAARRGTGMGMTCADYDGDGDTDVFVGNDVAGNFFWVNDGKGRFREAGLEVGVAYDFGGNAQGTMGVDGADFDNDGQLDFYMTSYQQETATLYRNLGDGTFEDVTRLTGAGDGTLPHVTWGVGFADFDDDGDRDIFVACGHLHDNVELFDSVGRYEAPNIVLMNELAETGRARFVNVSDRCGDGLLPERSSRGIGLDDLDEDGDIDIVVLNSRREPTLIRNDSKAAGGPAAGNHWIAVRLRGRRTNRDGIGARVKVVAGDLELIDEVRAGRGYQSHFGTRLHFGLGRRAAIDRIEVRWVGGGTTRIERPAADRTVTIVER